MTADDLRELGAKAAKRRLEEMFAEMLPGVKWSIKTHHKLTIAGDIEGRLDVSTTITTGDADAPNRIRRAKADRGERDRQWAKTILDARIKREARATGLKEMAKREYPGLGGSLGLMARISRLREENKP